MEYLVVGGAWILFLGLHSLFASLGFKAWVHGFTGLKGKSYRLTYSFLSILGIFGVLYLMLTATSSALFVSGEYLKYGAMVLASYGVILIVTSFRHMSAKAFLGLKSNDEQKLIKVGVHQHVRHPIYSGTILVFLGMFFYHPTDIILISVIINFGYLPIGIYLEERKLVREFGQVYEDYKAEVPSIVPRIFSK